MGYFNVLDDADHFIGLRIYYIGVIAGCARLNDAYNHIRWCSASAGARHPVRDNAPLRIILAGEMLASAVKGIASGFCCQGVGQ